MQQTSAKAFVSAIVGALASAAATYLGWTFGPEFTGALEIIVGLGVTAAATFAMQFLAVHQTSNAPAGGVVAVLPESVVGTASEHGVADSTAPAVTVHQTAAGETITGRIPVRQGF
jgi:hypothetical protein